MIKAINKYVLENGIKYTSAILPDDVQRGELGHCFDNSSIIAMHGKYKYVEGVAKSITTGKWLPHAWVTDGTHAFDPTWKCIATTTTGEKREVAMPWVKYVGIEIDIMNVAKFVSETEYAGIIPNCWRNPKLAKDILPCLSDKTIADIMQEYATEEVDEAICQTDTRAKRPPDA